MMYFFVKALKLYEIAIQTEVEIGPNVIPSLYQNLILSFQLVCALPLIIYTSFNLKCVMIEKLQDHSGIFFLYKILNQQKKSTYKMYTVFFLPAINIFVFPPSIGKKGRETIMQTL